MEKKYINMIYSLSEIDDVVSAIKHIMHSCSIIALHGSLGAGKTTLVKALLKACGVNDIITSPTFTYVNWYSNDKKEQFFHFDLYRIETQQQFQQEGFDEYLSQPHSWSIIEWPEVIASLLKKYNVCTLTIDYIDQDKRAIEISWYARDEGTPC